MFYSLKLRYQWILSWLCIYRRKRQWWPTSCTRRRWRSYRDWRSRSVEALLQVVIYTSLRVFSWKNISSDSSYASLLLSASFLYSFFPLNLPPPPPSPSPSRLYLSPSIFFFSPSGGSDSQQPPFMGSQCGRLQGCPLLPGWLGKAPR